VKSGAPPLQPGLVYDTGALIAADRDVRRMWALHARALARGVTPVVPAGCLVEAARSHLQVSLARLLDGCAIETLDSERARRAGFQLSAVTNPPGPVDATVVETALRRRASVVSSDPGDLLSIAGAANARLHIIEM